MTGPDRYFYISKQLNYLTNTWNATSLTYAYNSNQGYFIEHNLILQLKQQQTWPYIHHVTLS